MKVWIAKWDVRNGSIGVEVFASQALAVAAVMKYAEEMSLLGNDKLAVELAREQLVATGMLEFESAECYYDIEEHAVRIA